MYPDRYVKCMERHREQQIHYKTREQLWLPLDPVSRKLLHFSEVIDNSKNLAIIARCTRKRSDNIHRLVQMARLCRFGLAGRDSF